MAIMPGPGTAAPSHDAFAVTRDLDPGRFRFSVWRNVSVTIWTAQATMPAGERILRLSRELSREFPQGRSQVMIVADGTPAPDHAVSELLTEIYKPELSRIVCIAAVLEGTGFLGQRHPQPDDEHAHRGRQRHGDAYARHRGRGRELATGRTRAAYGCSARAQRAQSDVDRRARARDRAGSVSSLDQVPSALPSPRAAQKLCRYRRLIAMRDDRSAFCRHDRLELEHRPERDVGETDAVVAERRARLSEARVDSSR